VRGAAREGGSYRDLTQAKRGTSGDGSVPKVFASQPQARA